MSVETLTALLMDNTLKNVDYSCARMSQLGQNLSEIPKGGFFSESAMCFLDLKISKKNIPKNYPELEI